MNLTTEEKLVLLLLEQIEPAAVNQLAAQAGLSETRVKHLLRKLKEKGLIKESCLNEETD